MGKTVQSCATSDKRKKTAPSLDVFSLMKRTRISFARSSARSNSTKWKAIWPDSYAEDCYFSLLFSSISFRAKHFSNLSQRSWWIWTLARFLKHIYMLCYTFHQNFKLCRNRTKIRVETIEDLSSGCKVNSFWCFLGCLPNNFHVSCFSLLRQYLSSVTKHSIT